MSAVNRTDVSPVAFPPTPPSASKLEQEFFEKVHSIFVEVHDAKTRREIASAMSLGFFTRKTIQVSTNKLIRRIRSGKDSICPGYFIVLTHLFGKKKLHKQAWYVGFCAEHGDLVRAMPGKSCLTSIPVWQQLKQVKNLRSARPGTDKRQQVLFWIENVDNGNDFPGFDDKGRIDDNAIAGPLMRETGNSAANPMQKMEDTPMTRDTGEISHAVAGA
ncbi:hypothetical protein JDV02_001214 [Purpureocillium takamizusanense]|uniref:Uncharacterized protein n=1 Tax=Purpureocillium takamizusanense TaxID=2060973 RepID=A0A9Q8V688_9HYPO|nr:uncharacterized protein JDV02_001214 [Purpureocillium takamizusanense]UNI14600.1 hypothetical protein JDV02_001214 [Purpureocillium takamizusanense]